MRELDIEPYLKYFQNRILALTLTMVAWSCRQGDQIKIYDGRPNTEMFLATGTVEEDNLSDFLTVQANLVAADKLYMLKKQV